MLEIFSAMRWTPALFIVIGISLVSHTPADNIDAVMGTTKLHGIGLDIVYHICSFAFLTISVLLAYRVRTCTTLVLISSAICIFGIIDELHQGFISGRTSSVSDMILNSIGVITTIGLLLIIKNIKRYC